jgi:hypothetical protein
MKVPEGKVAKNRMHLDWSAADRSVAHGGPLDGVG